MLWVDAAEIKFKISPHDDLKPHQGGDWDLERRYPLAEAAKHRAMAQRFVQGWPWEQTDLFKKIYSARIAKESIRGCSTMAELLKQYYDRVDLLYDDMQRRGFRADAPLPKFLIGRDGQVFIGNQGNHRLAIAQILRIPIAGEVFCRHKCSIAA